MPFRLRACVGAGSVGASAAVTSCVSTALHRPHHATAAVRRLQMLPLVIAASYLIGLQHLTLTAAKGTSFCDDDQGGFRTVFRDEFNGAKLDESKWNVEVTPAPVVEQRHSVIAERPRQRTRVRADCSGQGCIQLGSCRDAACVRSESYVDAGALTLRSSRTGTSNFTTGAVNTWGKVGWRASEGAFRVCISARLPGVGSDGSSQGLWPAHWLMPHDNTCDPDEGEMDIMEMVDGNGLYEATYHWETTFPKANCSYPTGHGHAFAVRARLHDDWIAGYRATVHPTAVPRHTLTYMRVVSAASRRARCQPGTQASMSMPWSVGWITLRLSWTVKCS